MDKFFESVKNTWAQLLTFWQGLSMTKRVVVVASLALVVVAIGGVLSLKQADPYEYVFVDVSPADQQAIVTHFKKTGYTDYLVDDKGVKVPVEQVPAVRMQLTQEGLPADGQVGWEKFDQQDFSRTEFERQIFRLRAIQGELSRTIMRLDGVSSARVHIVLPKQSVFVEDQKDATAAIYLKMKRGGNLDQRQIRGIVHLVSRSVEGLKPDNISIIDGEGNLLTKQESNDPNIRMTKEMMDHKRTLEKEMEGKVRTIVGRVVGPERVEAKVDVEVDFTQEERTTSDVDPDKVAIVSSNRTEQQVDGQGLNPTGIPGSKSNVPGEQEDVQMATSRAKSTRGSELTNYEVSKVISKKLMPVGNITRITAAVLVDGKQVYPVDGTKPNFEARTEDEMKKIEDLVRSAIGFKEGRDEVRVHNMMFQLDPFQVQEITEKKKEGRDYIMTLAVSAVVAMSLVFFFAFIVRPYFRWLSYDPQRKKDEALVEEFKPDLELSSVQNVHIKEDVPFEKMSKEEQIMFLAKHEPKRTTEAIRMLLNPHQTVHH